MANRTIQSRARRNVEAGRAGYTIADSTPYHGKTMFVVDMNQPVVQDAPKYRRHWGTFFSDGLEHTTLGATISANLLRIGGVDLAGTDRSYPENRLFLYVVDGHYADTGEKTDLPMVVRLAIEEAILASKRPRLKRRGIRLA